MKFVVKMFPEIMVKSRSVRKRFSKMLECNIRNVLRRHDEDVKVRLEWDKITVRSKNETPENRATLIEALKCTPGIAHFLEVQQSSFTDMEDIFQQTLGVWGEQLEGKTFCVRAKRVGKHDFSSIDLERYVGGGLHQHCKTAGVRLKKPDVTVPLEIEGDNLYIVTHRHPGLGGFPLATQEPVLSLISGGFDSGVSSFQAIKRGCRTHYCFFNLGGNEHEIGVKQVSHYLWSKYGSSHRVKFISINFEPVVAEILENVENGQMGVILKRMMIRAAGQVAQAHGIEALVTGEAIGQVSSQTLTNLRLIDQVTDTLILRPLAMADKPDIIETAREIGTLQFAETMPEFCGVISKSPTVKAVKAKIEAEEENFNFEILQKVIDDAEVLDIRTIAQQANEAVVEVETVQQFGHSDMVLDIRSPEEEDDSPLELEGIEVAHVPFYRLGNQFGDLDQSKTYLLYCDRGVMSKLQALLLKEHGYENVKVYRP